MTIAIKYFNVISAVLSSNDETYVGAMFCVVDSKALVSYDPLGIVLF